MLFDKIINIQSNSKFKFLARVDVSFGEDFLRSSGRLNPLLQRVLATLCKRVLA